MSVRSLREQAQSTTTRKKIIIRFIGLRIIVRVRLIPGSSRARNFILGSASAARAKCSAASSRKVQSHGYNRVQIIVFGTGRKFPHDFIRCAVVTERQQGDHAVTVTVRIKYVHRFGVTAPFEQFHTRAYSVSGSVVCTVS